MIAPYYVFNFLVPGVVFCVALEKIWTIDIAGPDLVAAAFVYYFVGMCVSRVGSLVVAPILRKTKLIKFSDYKDFLKAEAEDTKIQELLLTANFYRSILGGVVSFLALCLGLWAVKWNIISETVLLSMVGIAIVILVFQGYRKQNTFIKDRINYRK